jgi:FtsZ-interacting cell division protein ZipA
MVYVILAIIVIALIVAALLVTRQRRSQQLQEGFGPEYDRTVEERGGDRREAEGELRERRRRRDEFEVRDLDDDARDRYVERWRAAQRRFVDQPGPAVGEADALVIEVMRDRGYPVADEFEQRAADVSVDHPEVVEHYRAAHGISGRATSGDASTEDLRQAMVHFRALFAELLGYEGVERTGEPADEPRGGNDDRTPQDQNVR